MDKLIITAALTGSVTIPTQTPHLPITPEAIAADAIACARAGAAAVHLHARDPRNGRPSADPEIFREIIIQQGLDTGGTFTDLISLHNPGSRDWRQHRPD